MDSFEWMELQTLNSEIAAARSRLSTARANHDHVAMRILEEEISTAERRRTHLVAHLTTHLAGETDSPDPPTAGGDEPLLLDTVEADEEPLDLDQPITTTEPPAAADAAETGSEAAAEDPERQEIKAPETKTLDTDAQEPAAREADPRANRGTPPAFDWNRLTPQDITRAREEIARQRVEMQARHDRELQELDRERSEIAALEEAVDAFVERFLQGAGGADVVHLDEQREVRLQGRG